MARSSALTYGSSSLVLTPLIPVRTRLTNGSLANDLLAPAGPEPVNSESEPKPKAKSNRPMGPEKETPDVPAGGLPDHLCQRPMTRVASQGPRVAYRKEATISTRANGGTILIIGLTSSNLGPHRATIS